MNELIRSLKALALFTGLLGVLYPCSMTLLGKVLFPEKSKGSLIIYKNEVIGSELLAQSFIQPKYFWPRPSAIKFDPANSGASNLSLTSSDLIQSVKEREKLGFISEMRFASGSGLDPHISPEAVRAQLARIVSTRRLDLQQKRRLEELLKRLTEDRQFGFLGQPRINVLRLNLELDEHFAK